MERVQPRRKSLNDDSSMPVSSQHWFPLALIEVAYRNVIFFCFFFFLFILQGFHVNDKVLASWSDCRFYPAKVIAVNKDGESCKKSLFVFYWLLNKHNFLSQVF